MSMPSSPPNPSLSQPTPQRHRRRRPLGLAALVGAVAVCLVVAGCGTARGQAEPPSLAGMPPVPSVSEQRARLDRLDAEIDMPDASRWRSVWFDWTDSGRQRAVPARLYLPAQVSTPVPLVVFSHGIGGSREGYSYLGAHLAAEGFAALHLQHVGSDNRLWRGNPLELLARLQTAAQDAEAVARAQDVSFALDRLLAEPAWSGAIDAQRIVAAGHSYGANTALLVAGARVTRGGAPVQLADARVRAAVLISAPPFYGEASPAPIVGGLSVPTLHITATGDTIQIPGYESPYSDRLALFEASGGPHKWLAVFRDGSHSMFTDRLGTGGTQLNPAVKRATRELVSAFLRSDLGADPQALRSWEARHRDWIARTAVHPTPTDPAALAAQAR